MSLFTYVDLGAGLPPAPTIATALKIEITQAVMQLEAHPRF
jgi:hypothetical protein